MDNVLTKRLLRGSWVCLVLILMAVSLYFLMPLIYPFLIAWLVAYAINPLVRWLQSAVRLPRWLSVTAALIICFGSAGLVLSAMVTRLVRELITLAESLNFHIEEWRNFLVAWSQSEGIQNILSEINRFVADNPGYEHTINKNIDNTALTIGSALSRVMSGILSGIVNLLSSLPNLGVILIVILLATFFISNNWDRNKRYLGGVIPTRFRTTAGEIWTDLHQALLGYFRAQFIMISITAFIVFIGLLILQVDSAFSYALLIGFVDLLPYLGVGTVMVPWLLYAYMTGATGTGIGLSILYGVILLARQFIEPKVLATSVGLDPLPTLISMFVGLKLFGVLGLIIGPVSFVIAGAIVRAGVVRDLRNYILNGRLR